MNIPGEKNISIRLQREGSSSYTKTSHPVRYGHYSELDFREFRIQFNLNGEVKHVAGTGPDWPHPAEWLKRTPANDWVYYSTGNYYSGVVDLFGEYYFPYPAYPTNCLLKENPFSRKSVRDALAAVAEAAGLARKKRLLQGAAMNADLKNFLEQVGKNSAGQLQKRGDRLHRILQAQIRVLPPDCRHVDYDVIPVMISDGCLYNCAFCEVKSGLDFSARSREEISEQLHSLDEFYGPDLVNYNSIYLGQHDALASEPADILFAAEAAYDILRIDRSHMQGANLFIFGSTESFLNMKKSFWERLNGLPYYSYINIGLESFDDVTLEFLKKPVRSRDVLKTFHQMLDLNNKYGNIEITANFLLGEELPPAHLPALSANLGDSTMKPQVKGCIYLSPLKGSMNSKMLLEQFREIKHRSRLPTFLYLIQRL